MNPVLWLRISSIVSVLFAAGHALGGRKSWSPLGETAVLSSMRDYRFDVLGVNRSYFDFYLGFGHSLTVFLLLQAVVLWQLGTLARTAPLQVRPIVASFVVATVAGGIVSWIFIFPIPTALSAVLAVCLALAFFAAR